jgi:hypothetical protein
MARSTGLAVLVVANLVASILHFSDNIAHFHEYPEPAWIPSPGVVDGLWFVITPLLLLGWWLAARGIKTLSVALLWLYGALSLSVLGHYRFASPSNLSLRINLLIGCEALAALLLLVLAPMMVRARVQPGPVTTRHEEVEPLVPLR